MFAFSGEFDGLEAGAVWQDLKTGIKDWSAWERVALVTDNAVVARRREHVRLGHARRSQGVRGRRNATTAIAWAAEAT